MENSRRNVLENSEVLENGQKSLQKVLKRSRSHDAVAKRPKISQHCLSIIFLHCALTDYTSQKISSSEEDPPRPLKQWKGNQQRCLEKRYEEASTTPSEGTPTIMAT